MKNFEYIEVDLNLDSTVGKSQRMNEFGKNGWELAGIERGIYIFKREKVEQQVLNEEEPVFPLVPHD